MAQSYTVFKGIVQTKMTFLSLYAHQDFNGEVDDVPEPTKCFGVSVVVSFGTSV